jgi:hypothetical protein
MQLPLIAKIWASVLLVILLIVLSGIVYIATREEEPVKPSYDTLKTHLESLQVKAEGKVAKELDKAISR